MIKKRNKIGEVTTDFDFLNNREKNQKNEPIDEGQDELSTKKKRKGGEFGFDVDATPQESGGGYDESGGQDARFKCTISPTAGRKKMRVFDSIAKVFAGGLNKTASNNEVEEAIVDVLYRKGLDIDSGTFNVIKERVATASVKDKQNIGEIVEKTMFEVRKAGLEEFKKTQSMFSRGGQTLGGKSYRFASNAQIKIEKSQVTHIAEEKETIESITKKYAKEMDVEIEPKDVENITDEVKKKVDEGKEEVTEASIKYFIHNAVEKIAYTKKASAMNKPFKSTAEQILHNSKWDANMRQAMMLANNSKDIVKTASATDESKLASAKVKLAAEPKPIVYKPMKGTPKNKGLESEELEGAVIPSATKPTTEIYDNLNKVIEELNTIDSQIEEDTAKIADKIKTKTGYEEKAEMKDALIKKLALKLNSEVKSNKEIVVKVHDNILAMIEEKSYSEPTDKKVLEALLKKHPELAKEAEKIKSEATVLKSIIDVIYGFPDTRKAANEKEELIKTLESLIKSYEYINAILLGEEQAVEKVEEKKVAQKVAMDNQRVLIASNSPDRYPYVDQCRNCSFFWSGVGTLYSHCTDCIHFYNEEELKGIKKEDAAELGDHFYDKSTTKTVGVPTFQQKHSSLNKKAEGTTPRYEVKYPDGKWKEFNSGEFNTHGGYLVHDGKKFKPNPSTDFRPMSSANQIQINPSTKLHPIKR